MAKVFITLFFSLISFCTFAKTSQIVLISQVNGASAQTDQKIQEHLQKQGYTVKIEDQSIDPQNLKRQNIDLIILSSTVASKSLKSGWRDLDIPLMTWEADYVDDLAMTGKRSGTDYGTEETQRYLWLVNSPNPLSAGFKAGTINVYKKQATMGYGKPGLGATIIATLYGQPEKPAIWAYQKGATMDYETLAPEKRMMFFLDNDTFTNLSDDGLKLFDTAVKWMVN